LVLNELAARRSAVLVPAAAFFREQLKTAVQRGEVRADIDLDIAAHLVATLAGPGIVDALSFKLGNRTQLTGTVMCITTWVWTIGYERTEA
jgi:molybdopterin-binding protein